MLLGLRVDYYPVVMIAAVHMKFKSVHHPCDLRASLAFPLSRLHGLTLTSTLVPKLQYILRSIRMDHEWKLRFFTYFLAYVTHELLTSTWSLTLTQIDTFTTVHQSIIKCTHNIFACLRAVILRERCQLDRLFYRSFCHPNAWTNCSAHVHGTLVYDMLLTIFDIASIASTGIACT